MTPPVSRPVRRVGKDGPEATSVAFGAMGLGLTVYGAMRPDKERLKVLDCAWENGCTNWDTAYPYGDSEEIIGKWLKLHPERREDIFLASKFGFKKADGGFEIDSTPEHCRETWNKSAQRLGVSCIDLWYMHRADEVTPIEKTVEEMVKLKAEGKIKYLGLSEVSSSALRRAYAVHPIAAVQVEYNPWTIDIEGSSGTNIFDTCKELGVAVFAYSPLGRGLITGRFRSLDDFDPNDVRRGYTRFQPAHFAKNVVLVNKFHELAKKKGCTPSQLVLAWLLAQDESIFVVPGTQTEKYLIENVESVNVKLSQAEEQEIRNLVQEAEVSGSRDSFFGEFSDTAPLKA